MAHEPVPVGHKGHGRDDQWAHASRAGRHWAVRWALAALGVTGLLFATVVASGQAPAPVPTPPPQITLSGTTTSVGTPPTSALAPAIKGGQPLGAASAGVALPQPGQAVGLPYTPMPAATSSLAQAQPFAPLGAPLAFGQPGRPPVPPPPTGQPGTGQPGTGQPQPRPLTPPGAGPRLSDLIGGVHPRLEGLPSGLLAPIGTTPVPDKATLRKFDEWVGPFVDPENTITLVIGRPRLWFLKKAPIRIQVGDPAVMDYTNIGRDPRELSLEGRAVGTTVLNLWFGDPDDILKQTVLSYLVQVIPDPEAKERLERVYKALEDELNRYFPDSYICLFLVGDKLVVAGEAKDAIEAQQILRILNANAPQNNNQPVSSTNATNIPVTNAVFDPVTGAGIGPNGQILPALSQYIVNNDNRVINMLRIPGEQQVMLKVTVAEVSRSAARSLGLNARFTNNQGIQYFAQLTGTPVANLPTILDSGQVNLAIEALRNLKMARSLAEPNLVTLNGFPAFFLSGGQFPVPIVTGATAVGLQGVSFVPFGVQLQFTPFIADKDRVRLQVFATVSTRDVSIGTNISGANVPGLNQRTVQTTVDMREGQTLAIAGLLQNNLAAESNRVPGLGDVPFGGQLFRVDRTQHSESELIVLVTPQLVHPLEPKELPPLPGSDYFEPSDAEFYLLGRLESRRSYDFRSPVMTTPGRMAAYRCCELLYFVGPHGHCDPK